MSAETSEVQVSAILKLAPEQASAKLDAMSPQEQLDLVLSVPEGRGRMKLILLTRRNRELLQSMPPEDMVLTVKDIGDHDAVPLLELSSDEQLTYLFDLELWIQSGMDLQKLTHWLGLLFECGNDRVRSWLVSTDFEQLMLLFERTLLLVQRDEIESLPEVVSARVTTPDDTHFFVVKLGVDYGLIKKLLDLIYDQERELFFALFLNLGTVPTAELEEQAYRWRCSRLADRGWPDFQEANQLYQAKNAESIQTQGVFPFGIDNHPRYPLKIGYGGRLFNQGMNMLESEDKTRVANQLANLINRVMVADNMMLTEIASFKKAASRIWGHLEIGLFALGVRDQAACLKTLRHIPLLELFQVAHGEIRKRAHRTKMLLRTPSGSLSHLLGTPLVEKIKDLLGPRPLFFSETDSVAIEFSDPQELNTLDRDLDLVEAAFACCQGLGLKKNTLSNPFPPGCYPESSEGLTLFTLLNTAFSNHRLGLDSLFLPLPFDRLNDLLSILPKNRSHLSEDIRKWSLSFLSKTPAGLDQLVDKLTSLLVDQVYIHDLDDLDHRFIEGLWIRKQIDG